MEPSSTWLRIPLGAPPRRVRGAPRQWGPPHSATLVLQEADIGYGIRIAAPVRTTVTPTVRHTARAIEARLDRLAHRLPQTPTTVPVNGLRGRPQLRTDEHVAGHLPTRLCTTITTRWYRNGPLTNRAGSCYRLSGLRGPRSLSWSNTAACPARTVITELRF